MGISSGVDGGLMKLTSKLLSSKYKLYRTFYY